MKADDPYRPDDLGPCNRCGAQPALVHQGSLSVILCTTPGCDHGMTISGGPDSWGYNRDCWNRGNPRPNVGGSLVDNPGGGTQSPEPEVQPLAGNVPEMKG